MRALFITLLFLGAFAFPALSAEPPSALVARGDALDRQLRTREALAAYLEAETAGGADSELLRKIAKQYAEAMTDEATQAEKRRLGEQALAYAKRSVEADARSAKAHLSLAICYGRLAPLLDNRTKIEYSRRVKDHADRALKLDPSDDYAWHVLGAWNYELANLNAVLRGLAGLIYGSLPRASNDRAAECFQKAIELAPQRVSHHIELGRTYAAMGRDELARAALRRGLALPSREKDDAETKQRGRAALGRI
jgi:tetratricopeptide (TPR) repeat protein